MSHYDTKTETTTESGLKSDLKSGLKTTPTSGLNKTDAQILESLEKDSRLTIVDLMENIGLSRNGVKKALGRLKAFGVLRRVGPDKGGHWEVVAEAAK